MNKIKSFIYLDDSKMYSFSSQLFEGVTQYILKEQTSEFSEENQQKGSLLSGRFMADMMFQKNANTEMRYLHDFAFNLFEKELNERKQIYDVTESTKIEDLRDKSFVKIKGRIIFEDYSTIINTLENFNDVGRAIAFLQNEGIQNQIDAVLDSSDTKDRELNHKKKQQGKLAMKMLNDELVRQGVNIEKSKIENLLTVMNYGFHDTYVIRMVIDNSETHYTAIINKDYLKEDERVLISKYSRITEKEFTIIGVVTQCGNPPLCIPDIEGNGIKNAMVNVIDKIANLENHFIGRSINECIIDPIAIFTEI